mgnify:CR=1 FL=1
MNTAPADNGPPSLYHRYMDTVLGFIRSESDFSDTDDGLKEELVRQETAAKESMKARSAEIEEEFKGRLSSLEKEHKKCLNKIAARRDSVIHRLKEKVGSLKSQADIHRVRAHETWTEARATLVSMGLLMRHLDLDEPKPVAHAGGNDSVEVLMAGITQRTDTIVKGAVRIQHAIEDWKVLKRRRRRIRVLVLLVAAVVGVLSYVAKNQYEITVGYDRALKLLEAKDWRGLANEVRALSTKLDFRRSVAWWFPVGQASHEETSLFPNNWNYHGTDFSFVMFEMEAFYQQGATEFVNKQWEKALEFLIRMQEAESAYRKNNPDEKEYSEKLKEYQKVRNLKVYFLDVSPLIQDSLYQAGMNAFQRKDWKGALKFFEQLPTDEKYDRIIRECYQRLQQGRRGVLGKVNIIGERKKVFPNPAEQTNRGDFLYNCSNNEVQYNTKIFPVATLDPGSEVEILDITECGDYFGPFIKIQTKNHQIGYVQFHHHERKAITIFDDEGAFKILSLETIKCENDPKCYYEYHVKPYEEFIKKYPDSAYVPQARRIVAERTVNMKNMKRG